MRLCSAALLTWGTHCGADRGRRCARASAGRQQTGRQTAASLAVCRRWELRAVPYTIFTLQRALPRPSTTSDVTSIHRRRQRTRHNQTIFPYLSICVSSRRAHRPRLRPGPRHRLRHRHGKAQGGLGRAQQPHGGKDADYTCRCGLGRPDWAHGFAGGCGFKTLAGTGPGGGCAYAHQQPAAQRGGAARERSVRAHGSR